MPGFTRATLNRQIVLGLSQLLLLLALLILLLLDLALLFTLLLLNLLLLLTLDIALLQFLLLDLLLLLTFDLTLLILLFLNLALLVVLLLIDLLLLFALNVALLVLLLLLLNLALLLLLLILLKKLLLVLPLLTVASGRIIAFVRQRVGTYAQAQQTQTRELPDARFHAFLTRARMDVIETVIAMRRSAHFIRTQRKGDPLAPLGYFVLRDACGIGSLHAVLWTVCSPGAWRTRWGGRPRLA